MKLLVKKNKEQMMMSTSFYSCVANVFYVLPVVPVLIFVAVSFLLIHCDTV